MWAAENNSCSAHAIPAASANIPTDVWLVFSPADGDGRMCKYDEQDFPDQTGSVRWLLHNTIIHPICG